MPDDASDLLYRLLKDDLRKLKASLPNIHRTAKALKELREALDGIRRARVRIDDFLILKDTTSKGPSLDVIPLSPEAKHFLDKFPGTLSDQPSTKRFLKKFCMPPTQSEGGDGT